MNHAVRRSLPWLLVAVFLLVSVALVARPYIGSSDGNSAETAGAVIPVVPQQPGDDASIRKLQDLLKKHPDDFAAHINLANAYLQKARESGDPRLYTQVDELLAQAAKIEPENPELFATQAVIALARHDFAGGLVLGQKALALDPERSRFFGVVADAQIQLGQYPEAVNSLQEMVNRRPDFASYSRIAYARELHGDPEGAVEMMTAAIEANSSVPENIAWAHVQVGNLFFAMGNPGEATKAYTRALQVTPDYAPALAGEARLAAAARDFATAAALYTKAFERLPSAAYAIDLGDVYSAQGDAAKADQQYALVRAIDALYADNGTNTDLELAAFFADRGDAAEAVRRARAAYESQPNVYAADTLGWALYRSGDVAGAQKYSAEALKLGTRDATMLYHAGVIAREAGKPTEAQEYLRQALATNKDFSILHSADAQKAFQDLGNLAASAAR